MSVSQGKGFWKGCDPADSESVSPWQECEDLRKENKYLANEIHMERITMRTENELIMRNLRNLNQELQADVKEVGRPPVTHAHTDDGGQKKSKDVC